MEDNKIVTGLETAADRKEAEFDLAKSLLAAAEYKTDEDAIVEAEIKRNGIVYFSVHLHPVSDPDARFARKKATVMMPNPTNKKLPPIEKDFNNAVFGSWMIYMATTEADQQKIWGDRGVMNKYDLKEPWESIDILLTMGEKKRLLDLITEISGMDDDEDVDQEEYAKN